MKKLISILIIAFVTPALAAEGKPIVDWYIQTVISSEIPNRHNVIKRAVLLWGETWPSIKVEIIDWKKGMGGQRILASKSIGIEGVNRVCPDPAESWCGKIGEISWNKNILTHHFSAKGDNYACKTEVSGEVISNTYCAKQP